MKDEDAYVWIDPARRSGEPCMGGSRLAVDAVVDSVWDTSVDNAMDLYCISRAQVLVACWYAAAGFPILLHGKRGKYSPKPFKHRTHWAAWGREAHSALWQSTTVDYDAIPDPPTPAGTTTAAPTSTPSPTTTTSPTTIETTEVNVTETSATSEASGDE